MDQYHRTRHPKGIEQAKALSGEFDLVISSPLCRALQTLAYSSITSRLPFQIWKDVRERVLHVSDLLPEEAQTLTGNLTIESYDELSKRGDGVFNKLKQLPPEVRTILIVSHCEFITELAGVGLHNAQMHSIEY